MPSNTRRQLEDWLKKIKIPDNASVLDIGGAQLPVKKRVGQWGQNINYKILDLENPHIEKQKPDILYDLQNLDLEGRPEEFFKFFDLVFCLEVSEYWFSPLDAMDSIYFMLKPGGILYISFHYIYPHHDPEGEDCLRYTSWGVDRLLDHSGFEILEKTPRVMEIPEARLCLKNVYCLEGMKMNKTVPISEVGYLIKAKKI